MANNIANVVFANKPASVDISSGFNGMNGLMVITAEADKPARLWVFVSECEGILRDLYASLIKKYA